MKLENVPLDVVPLIFEHLTDGRDLYNCVQLNKAFNRAATPFLYRTLDTRIGKTRRFERARVLHPSRTLLEKPYYAKYVRHVSETAAVGFNMPELMPDCRKALALCTNLTSFSWTDDSADGANSDYDLLAFLDILQQLPRLQEFTIHTYVGLSETVWAKLTELSGLQKVAIWCMEGQPRILQGWSEKLGNTLTHLELGVSGLSPHWYAAPRLTDLTSSHPPQRCAGVPASILVSVLSHLTHLRALRLKGAPSSAILEILALLPSLVSLDTEYFSHGRSKYADEPLASLRELTVRTSSVDVQGPQQLWPWIRTLVPRPSLESFTLNAFSTLGAACVPRRFILDLAETHGKTLKSLTVHSAQLTLEDIECVCTMFPMLEVLACTIGWSDRPDPNQIEDAIANGHNLRELRLQLSWNWVPTRENPSEKLVPLSLENVRNVMLRKQSQLRVVGVGRVLYKGSWVRAIHDDGSSGLTLNITSDVVNDKWI